MAGVLTIKPAFAIDSCSDWKIFCFLPFKTSTYTTPTGIMSGQAYLDTVMNDWIDATKKAVSDKEEARKFYDKELEYGMEPVSFDDWVQVNASILKLVIITLHIINAQSTRLLHSLPPSTNTAPKKIDSSTCLCKKNM